ncbi:MAG: Ig-like domain-containing protein [Nitrospirae bacterium]|nr:Ig-like domain-containing protein [Nitrospirota bacterium]
MKILKKHNNLLLILLAVAFIFAGCGSWTKGKDGSVTIHSSAFPEMKPKASKVRAYLELGGKTCEFELDSDDTTLKDDQKCSDFKMGSHTYMLVYKYIDSNLTYSGVELAKTEGTVTFASGKDNEMFLAPPDKDIDDDGDGFKNFYEILQGTDPKNKDSKPVEDKTPPTVSSTNPVNGATNIPVNATITANFSEPIDSATVTKDTFTVSAGSNNVTGTFTVSGTSATFTPSGNITENTTCTVTITTGVKDLAGNTMAGNFTWSFTTVAGPDKTPPTVSSAGPANASTNVPVNSTISATFSEPMNSVSFTNDTFKVFNGSNNITGTITVSGTTATFTPSGTLSDNTTHTVTITTGVKDSAGNAMASDYAWSFTTTQKPPSDGLIAYFSFDQCNANDDSGGGYNGTLYGNPECKNRGNSKALNIDSTDDYVKLAKTVDPNNAKSFSFWINSRGKDSVNEFGTLMAKYNLNGNRSLLITTFDSSGTNAIGVTLWSGGSNADSVSSYYKDTSALDTGKYTVINNNELGINVWEHVVINITSSEIEIWIDGQITNKVKRGYLQYFNSGEPTYIGNSFNIGSDFVYNNRLNGTIDNFRIYNRPLTESEIQTIFSYEALPSIPDKVTATSGERQTTINWNAVPDATSYNIYWSTVSGVNKGSGTKISGIIETSKIHEKLTEGTTYYYVVTSENSKGESDISKEVSAKPTYHDTIAPINSSDSGFINSGANSTDSTNVTLSISATDNVGVTAYYVADNATGVPPATPAADATGWVSVSSSKNYSAGVSYVFPGTYLNGTELYAYIWFKDAAGNISMVGSDSITFNDSVKPTNTTPPNFINSGVTSTLSNTVSLSLAATDNTGVTGYYVLDNDTGVSPDQPASNITGWIDITPTTNYSANVNYTFKGSYSIGKTVYVYVWFKDASGNVSAVATDSINITAIIFSYDFEGGIGNWSDTYGVWEVGNATSGPSGCYNGSSKCAATVLAGNYPQGTRSSLVSPSIQLPPIANGEELHLRFWHWFSFAGEPDGTTDRGNVRISKETSPGVWSDPATNNAKIMSFSGYSGIWSYPTVDLTGYAGMKIKIYFELENPTSAWGSVAAGWYIDDLSITYVQPILINKLGDTYSYGFEGGISDWSAKNGVWEVGTATSGPGGCYNSSSKCAATVLAGNYPQSTWSSLISPSIKLPAIGTGEELQLRFWHWFSFAGEPDGTKDIGDIRVFEETSPGVWSSSNNDILNSYSGSSGVWSYPLLHLEKYAGKKIRIYFEFQNPTSAWGSVGPGWYIDDVSLSYVIP